MVENSEIMVDFWIFGFKNLDLNETIVNNNETIFIYLYRRHHRNGGKEITIHKRRWKFRQNVIIIEDLKVKSIYLTAP